MISVGSNDSILQADRIQRREPVEPNRAVCGCISTGRQDQHPVAFLQANGQAVGILLIHHICAVTAGACDYNRAFRAAIIGCFKVIANCFVHGFCQAGKLSDIQVNPTTIVAIAFFRHQHDFAYNTSRIGHQAAAGFCDHMNVQIAKMTQRMGANSFRINARFLSL